MKVSTIEDLIAVLKDRKQKVFIWGTGINGKALGVIFNEHNVSWNGYFNNFDYGEKCINGKAVIVGDKELILDGLYILAMRNYKDVYNQLLPKVGDSNLIVPDGMGFFRQLEQSINYPTSYSNEIKQFHLKHKDSRCFIIGNGPSLQIEDLDKICNNKDISFGSNYIFKCFEKTNWRPNYYFCTDASGINSCVGEQQGIEYISNNCEQMFLRYVEQLKMYKNRIKNISFINSVYSSSEVDFDFSEDCSKEVIIGYTVTYVMMQMAVYMGFTEIYLLGMDHSFSRERTKDGRFIEQKKQDHSKILDCGNVNYFDIDKVTLAYMAAKKYTEKHGIHIYNATRGGKLEVFERRDFDSLF